MTIAYLLFFLISVFLFRIAKFREMLEFINRRSSLLWVTAAIVVVILISLPVWALYYDFHNKSEMFPSVRIFQKNENNLVKLYASDIKEDLFF